MQLKNRKLIEMLSKNNWNSIVVVSVDGSKEDMVNRCRIDDCKSIKSITTTTTNGKDYVILNLED